MLSCEWLSRNGLLENLYASVTHTHGNGNVDDQGDYNSFIHFVQLS